MNPPQLGSIAELHWQDIIETCANVMARTPSEDIFKIEVALSEAKRPLLADQILTDFFGQHKSVRITFFHKTDKWGFEVCDKWGRSYQPATATFTTKYAAFHNAFRRLNYFLPIFR
ncbi:hypothetical protein CLV58_14124 [Spirosoma oryzae]|uniref:Uncharacterized protein n=1 Tax=Spirosoma oryzae TaxID=1469603 RepID=A0A2T0RQY4_9BACT|nr:hypothetical protein [Spirosoma oryzae]PRY23503.1 hypothetical protein CLV58_14124 [Spirosoma oryzae]